MAVAGHFSRARTRLAGRGDGVWLIVAAAITWLIVFGRLGSSSLFDPDEAHYAQLTREMIRSHSWLVPLLDGTPFIDKPVLFHWLQMACIALFGDSEFALRLPSALGGIALLWVTRWLASELFGAATGNMAALMFATLPLTFALANIGLFDMVYTAFLFAAVACLIVSAVRGRERLQYVGYLLLTLAVMTKGPVALLLVVLLALLTFCADHRMRPGLQRLHWRTGVLLVAVLASPWFVYMWVAFNQQFVHDYLLAGNLWYFTGPKAFSARVSDHWFYVRTVSGRLLPLEFHCDRLRRGRVHPAADGTGGGARRTNAVSVDCVGARLLQCGGVQARLVHLPRGARVLCAGGSRLDAFGAGPASALDEGCRNRRRGDPRAGWRGRWHHAFQDQS